MSEKQPNGVHKSVLLHEVIDLLMPHSGMTVIDGTVGLGGHAAALASAIGPEGLLIGCDCDEASLRVADERLRQVGTPYRLIHTNFSAFKSMCAKEGITTVDRILLDIGFSSWQIDNPERGFSFMHDGPLDMRMDPSQSLTACDVVNTFAADDLSHIIADYGEDRFSRRIAGAIVRRRNEAAITTTTQLAEVIAAAVPGKFRHQRIHPATRTFQALRIYVNDELNSLRAVLNQIPELVRSGGRVAIISFHSLEDRIVKRAFRTWARDGSWDVLTRRPLRPADEEVRDNPRARSARLRVCQKV